MNLDFQSDYTPALILGCILLGASYAWFLYKNDRSLAEAFKERPIYKYGLGFFRFITITIIAILLLTPVLRNSNTKEEKPIIIIAHDNSESMNFSFGKNENEQKENIKSYIATIQKELITPLKDNFETYAYSFGTGLDSLKFDFSEKETDFSDLMDELSSTYLNQNVGAIILVSDGIYNKGRNPIYIENRLAAPIYTVAMGDTIKRKDLILDKVNHNRLVYLGNKFPLEPIIRAQNCKGAKTTLKIEQINANKSLKIHEEEIEITEPYIEKTIPVLLEAKSTGILHYRVSVSPVPDEVSIKNNFQDVFIEVLDTRQKILLLANSPHPDIRALKYIIEHNENLEVDIQYAKDFKGKPADYSLVVAHQVPGTSSDASKLLGQFNELKIPVLFIVGAQSNLNSLNAVQNLIQYNQQLRSTNDVFVQYNNDFSVFSLDDATKDALTDFPPLKSPYADYKVNPASKIMLLQKIGNISTAYPLLLFNSSETQRIGILNGEGIWRWQLYNYHASGSHEAINNFVGKIVQFLSVKVDRRKFRVINHKNDYKENEEIVFDAELYNEAYDLVNSVPVNLIITDAQGNEFTYTFLNTEKAYTLNVGTFPIGNYQYKATVSYNGKSYEEKGQYIVSPLRLEYIQTTANHQLLNTFAEQSGGKLFYPDNLKELTNEIQKRVDIVPVIHTEYTTDPVINLYWILILLLSLLSVEWFTRKLLGAV